MQCCLKSLSSRNSFHAIPIHVPHIGSWIIQLPHTSCDGGQSIPTTAIVSARVTAASSHAVGFQHNEPRPDEAAQSGRQRRSYEQLRVRRNWPLSFQPARCLWSGPDRVRCQGRCCHPWDWRPANDKLGRAACSAIGCPAGGIRLTNWDAHALAELVHKGTRWIFY